MPGYIPLSRNQLPVFLQEMQRPPAAWARVRGSQEYPAISGVVRFYPTAYGVLICTHVTGLPVEESTCGGRFFSMHIHSGNSCSGIQEDPFADAMMHFNPSECSHPSHAGDLPPLLADHGYAFAVCLSDRFSVSEIIGRTVILHARPDDFMSQPAGNAGEKIACGEIVPNNRHTGI